MPDILLNYCTRGVEVGTERLSLAVIVSPLNPFESSGYVLNSLLN